MYRIIAASELTLNKYNKSCSEIFGTRRFGDFCGAPPPPPLIDQKFATALVTTKELVVKKLKIKAMILLFTASNSSYG